MEISEIKSLLTIANVLHYYGLKADKTNRICCPFHEDKTPSMQVYYKTQTAYCFSSNCKTHGKSMDVIDFILHKENCTKHEAIKKAVEILGNQEPNKKDRYQKDSTREQIEERDSRTPKKQIKLSREQFLGNMFQYFRNAINNSKPAKDYLQKRGLDPSQIEVGYNSGQFHHGSRRDEQLIQQCVEYGLLLDKGIFYRKKGEIDEGDSTTERSQKAYGVFGKWCIVFALKNRANEVTGLYFRSTLNDEKAKHFYLKDRQGIYPNYPGKETKKLILTEAIIDAASLLQVKEIRENYGIVACFGTNGLNDEILSAIKELPGLEEIIFCFDQDEAGKAAVEKYAEMLKHEHLASKQTVKDDLIMSQVVLPCKDVNETLQLHDEEIFTELLEKRNFIFSSENGGGIADQLQSIEGSSPFLSAIDL